MSLIKKAFAISLAMAAKDLVVYVIGISGKCSKDYNGCGKSCMCRQFMYNEYMEESYSTLLQAEFDNHVINQQHTIYWGRKEKTCMLSNEKINFEVFEHTVLYQNDINKPFHGHENYENRVFTPCNRFLNKPAFRSCKDMLNPEEYGNKKFLHSANVPVAFLYVVDVSQSCFVFEMQINLMNRLMKSITKTYCCVVVASKFDTHCEANVKCLETFANSMNVTVIKCSAKHNTNVDAAFECLAIEALSLNKTAAKVQDVTQKQTLFAV